MVDWSELLEKGGLSFVVIIGLGWAILRLWQRLNAVQDARIEDQKEHTAQLIETNKLVDSAVRAMEARK